MLEREELQNEIVREFEQQIDKANTFNLILASKIVDEKVLRDYTIYICNFVLELIDRVFSYDFQNFTVDWSCSVNT